MSILVGYGPNNNDRSAIELACQLARSEHRPVHAVSVVPRGWGTPAAAGTDREFQAWANDEGEVGAEQARADFALHPGVEASASWVSGRSVPQSLLEQAAERDAWVLVVGSSDEADRGRIRLSSKTDRLVHSAPVPVAIAPRGYRTDSPVTRVTVGFRDDDASWSMLTRVAEMSRRVGARLRLVTFIVSPPRRSVTTTVTHAETQVFNQWMIQVGLAQREAADYLQSKGFSEADLEFRIAEGYHWAAAIGSLEWADGDILVVGSSTTNPVARVFLGSSATKIVRNSPVPVIAVPGKGTD